MKVDEDVRIEEAERPASGEEKLNKRRCETMIH
jgi:hypothetical protein